MFVTKLPVRGIFLAASRKRKMRRSCILWIIQSERMSGRSTRCVLTSLYLNVRLGIISAHSFGQNHSKSNEESIIEYRPGKNTASKSVSKLFWWLNTFCGIAGSGISEIAAPAFFEVWVSAAPERDFFGELSSKHDRACVIMKMLVK